MYLEENVVLKSLDDIDVRFGLVYPNEYEIAMITFGYRLLYHMLNERKDCFCERIIYPSVESIETETNLAEFDILRFSIHYTEDYFKVIEMLRKANIPVLRKDRTDDDPLIIAGGPCVTANPMPLSDFIDIFCIGEGEDVLTDLTNLYKKFKTPKKHLKEFTKIEGLYVPKFNNSTNLAFVENMDEKFHYTNPIVVKDNDHINNIYLDVSRGCSRGCRFCMSGFLYRPVRETSVEKLIRIAEKSRENTGINKIWLIGFAVSDYSRINDLIDCLQERNFRINLPSLRIESITTNVLENLKNAGISDFAIALESTSKLRKSMNKDIPEESIQNLIKTAFKMGFNMKFLFILGFPNETDDDVIELANYIKSIINTKNSINKDLSLSFQFSLLTPKPQTPIQWETYDMDVIESKMDLFVDEFIDLDLQFFKYTEDETWYVGESNNFKVIFSSNEKAFKDYILSCGNCEVGNLLLNGDFNNPIEYWKKYLPKYKIGDPLPWDVINMGYTNNFIEKEHDRIIKGKSTPWCEVSPCYKCKNNCFK